MRFCSSRQQEALQQNRFLLTARFIGIDGEPARVANGKDKEGKEQFIANAVPNEETALQIVEAATKADWTVRSFETKERKKYPSAPFTTSTLQQQAAARLGFNVRRTMGVAQRLYEGVDLGTEGTTGLITYMRTDSPRVAPEAISAAREWIAEVGLQVFTCGGQFLQGQEGRAGRARSHSSYRSHADAGIDRSAIFAEEQLKLYRLMWQRFVASQMTPAIYDLTTIEIDAAGDRTYNFRTTGSVLRFDGFLRVYGADDEEEDRLPEIPKGARLPLATRSS